MNIVKYKRSAWLFMIMLCLNGAFAQGYHIGDLYTAPDGSQGIVYYVFPDGSGGWVVALHDASSGCLWGNQNDVVGLDNQNPSNTNLLMYDTSGYGNTQIMRSSQNNNNYASGVVDFDGGWYLPSVAQLRMLYGQQVFISTNLLEAGGTIMSNDYYWTSTERNRTDAWCVAFGYGAVGSGYITYYSKTQSFHVRAVRSFSYTDSQASDVSYLWSTGATTPDITVSPTQTTTYTVTVSTSGGCADTVEQTIVVNSVTSETFYEVVCQGEPYTGHGFSLMAAETSTPGLITRTRTDNVGECPSTYTLELTVNAAPRTNMEASACDSYEWNGQTYTQSGDYTLSFPYSGDCDSTVTLHLTVTGRPEATLTVTSDTICEGNVVTLQTDVSVSSSGPVLYVPSVAIGDILCTDNSIVKPSAWPVAGKTAMGIVFYVDNTGQHGWAMHLHNQESNLLWSPTSSDHPELINYVEAREAITDFDGYGNTWKLRMAGTATDYPMAYAVDFNNGWYVPAAGQMNMIVSEIHILNSTLQVVGGTQFPTTSIWAYHTSTEFSDQYAWHIESLGIVLVHDKRWTYSPPLMIRSVRTF